MSTINQFQIDLMEIQFGFDSTETKLSNYLKTIFKLLKIHLSNYLKTIIKLLKINLLN